MKDIILQNITKRYYKGTEEKVIEEQLLDDGMNTLSDTIACSNCILFFATACDRDVLALSTKEVVHCINIETFFNQFPNIVGKRCDYILYNKNKIVLIDLTCSLEDYIYPHLNKQKVVRGKRLYAREQIEHTLDILMKEKEIKDYIDLKEQKIGLLGYRIKDEESFQYIPRKIDDVLNAWLAMERELETRKLQFPMSYGFKFEMVKTPEVYKW